MKRQATTLRKQKLHKLEKTKANPLITEQEISQHKGRCLEGFISSPLLKSST